MPSNFLMFCMFQVHSNLSGYLSPESSLDKTLGDHLKNQSNSDDPLPKGNSTDRRNVEETQPQRNTSQALKDLSDSDAKYYCSTDEPEPWDLIKLNLQASFICLSAKVSTICSAYHEAIKNCEKLAPLAQMDILSEKSTSSSENLLEHSAANSSLTPDGEISPTEDDSGICMAHEKRTPESERKLQNSKFTSDIIAETITSFKDICDASPIVNTCTSKPKLASIMETSREDTIECDEDATTDKFRLPKQSTGSANSDANTDTYESKSESSSELKNRLTDLNNIIPSVIKLREAVDGAVRTARLVHCLHRLQLPYKNIEKIHTLQYRRDACFSQALTAAISGLLNKFWNITGNVAIDQAFLYVVQKIGPLLQFEGLLSCIGSDGGRMSDMAVAVEDLKTVLFVVVPGDSPTPSITGNR